MIARKLSACLLVLSLTVSAFAIASFGARGNVGPQDPFGYYWTDSNSPEPTVAFNWVDITGTGTNTGLYADDSYAGPFSIGFSFEFYGNSYSQFYLSSNGFISFGAGYSSLSNTELPNTGTPNNIIAPYWDDMVIGGSGGVYYQTIGASPDMQLVIEFYNVYRYGSSSYLMTFEIILEETGGIWFQYLSLNGYVGASATVGIEDSTGTSGCQYLYNSAILSDNLAIMFDTGPVSITPHSEVFADWGMLATHTVVVTNNQNVTDGFDITYSSAVGWNVSLYNETMTPLSDNDGSPDVDTGDIPAGGSVTIYVTVEVPGDPVHANESTFVTATSWLNNSVSVTGGLSTLTTAALLTGNISDMGEDSDTDGDYDYLRIEAEVDVAGEGYYILEADLYDGAATYITYGWDEYYLTPGVWTIYALVSGEDIFASGLDGPYVVDIYLLDGSWMFLDAYYDYTTSAYVHDAFDPPPAMFQPPHSDSAVDENDTNSQYDYLVINASVVVYDADDYIVYAYLEDTTYGWYVYDVVVPVTLDVGMNNVSLVFPSLYINQSGLDGPYMAYLELYTSSWDGLDGDTHTTGMYYYDDFEGPRVEFMEPFDEVALDTDNDTYYNSLTVTAYIDCLEADYYAIDGWVYDPSLSSFMYFYEYLDLEVGLAWYNITLASEDIFTNWESGYWYFDLYLYDSGLMNELDNYWYESAYYYYYEFDPVGAFFDSIEDGPMDTDGDGYYNDVYVNITVDPQSSGDYVLVAYVYDYYGWWDITITESVYLEEGEPYIWLVVIPGYDIYLEWLEAPFELYLYTYDETMSYYFDYQYYETADYYPGDFDPVGAYFDSASDEGVDTDSDGFFNEIVATIGIYGEPSGYFYVYAYVYVYTGSYYSLFWIDDTVFIEEGVLFEWEIVVTGEEFLETGVNGYLYLEMYVYDADGDVYFDYMSHYSDYYYYLDDFDSIGASFEQPYEEAGVDDDGDGLYDWLVFTFYVNASSSGYYYISVWYRDYYYYFYDDAEFYVYLVEGERTALEIAISSTDIQRYTYGGYWYFDMELYDAITWTFYDYDDYWTETWYYQSDFDPLSAEFQSTHDDYGIDTDEDSYYDLYVMEIAVYAYDPGEYTVYLDLMVNGYLYEGASETQILSVGNNIVLFTFEGWMIYVAYPYYDYIEADLELYDDDGRLQDTDTYYSSYYYSYWEFEGPPAYFSSPHSDYAVDDDEDSLYEWLIVNATVYASGPGEYWVLGELYDYYYNLVDSFLTPASLIEGDNHVELEFDGWLVASAYDWPYYADLTLYDAAGTMVDTDYHYMDVYYDQDDFDPAPPEIESGWAYESPSVDGAVTVGEWFGATEVDAMAADSMNELAATMYVMNNGTHLFVLIDATGDLTESVDDLASVAFDTGNDGYWTDGQEDQFILMALDIGTMMAHAEWDSYYGYEVIHCAPFDDSLEDHEGLAGAAGFGPSEALSASHRVYELSIPLALFNVTLGDRIGFGGLSDAGPMAYDADEDIYSSWPVSTEYLDSLARLGDLVLSEERPLTTLDVAGDEGANGWFVSDVDVTLTATGGTGGVNATYYSLDGGAWVEYTGAFAVEDDGSHELMFYSDDNAGNAEPIRTALVMIDTVAPEVSAAVDGIMGLEGWVTENAAVVFTVTDDASGLSEVMCSMDGGDWEPISGTEMPVSEDGSHTVEYYAVDMAGHESSESTMTIKVDLAAPVTTALVDGSSVTLSALDGNGSGVSTTMYRIDGGDWKLYEDEFVVKGEGTHVLEYYSVDVAGLNETVRSVSVEGKAGILGMDAWVWAVVIAVVVAVVVVLLYIMMRRRPPQPSKLVPGEAVVEPMAPEPPPPPQA